MKKLLANGSKSDWLFNTVKVMNLKVYIMFEFTPVHQIIIYIYIFFFFLYYFFFIQICVASCKKKLPRVTPFKCIFLNIKVNFPFGRSS